ncbi:hypothetical protein BGZ70_001494 [Mortierella alpina]|uniref:Uncharacterized protein n=1 Tax=Mortierella alpina TaxID=64518 RepID=A0A9P6IWG3_MORAP|nr:hypothetical protein BGZ70_001494 [Mortierella alpina]
MPLSSKNISTQWKQAMQGEYERLQAEADMQQNHLFRLDNIASKLEYDFAHAKNDDVLYEALHIDQRMRAYRYELRVRTRRLEDCQMRLAELEMFRDTSAELHKGEAS